MSRKKQDPEDEQKTYLELQVLKAIEDNIQSAVQGFMERWLPMTGFDADVEVMSKAQLRNAMGLRAAYPIDPWPIAEKKLLDNGFFWHWMGGQRVMLLKERCEGVCAQSGSVGWADAEEWDD